MIGLGLAVLQQLTGINAIIYYSNSIFAAAGYATPVEQAQATTWGIGAVNVLSTFIAIAFIDRPRPAPAPDRGSHRHGAQPCRGRLRVLAIGDTGRPRKLGGRDHARRACRFHHLIRVLGSGRSRGQ